MSIIRSLKSFALKVSILHKEKKFANRLKYIFENNGSDTLLIIFSGFAEKPVYNYMRTLKAVKFDKLFILDDFGYRGSYYWYADGKDTPLHLVKDLISHVQNSKWGGYKKQYTLGTSKGGTCAIYFGLEMGATAAFAGACQYHIGSYLYTDHHMPIFKKMMGETAGELERDILDRMMPDQLSKHQGSPMQVHLMYSKDEHTYSEHIKDLISDLEANHIQFTEQIETFKDHKEVGKYFIPYIQKFLKTENS